MPEPAPPTAPSSTPGAPAFDPSRVFHANHFRVDIQNVGSAQFVEVSGLAVSVATIPFRAGGEGQVVHQLPGQVELSPLVCRFGVTASSSLWNWMQQSMRGRVARQNVSVLHLDTDGVTELKRYNLTDAWPNHWSAAEMHSLENHVAIETLSIVYESIDRA